MSVNDHRKCAKCGKTRSEDLTVTYHRFPNPGKANISKARAWAKYCWPDQNWTSEESLESLYKANKVLCGRHFSLSQFYDNCRQKLSKFAVPDEKIMIELLENKENLYTQTEQEPNVNVATASQSETRQILGYMHAEPSTSASTSQAVLLPTRSKSQIIKETEQEPNVNVATASQSETRQILGYMHAEPSTSASTSQAVLLPTRSKSQIIKEVEKPDTNRPQTKKKGGILRELSLNKICELTERESKLYKICKKHFKEIKRLRANLRKKKIKNCIQALMENESVLQLCNLNISPAFAVLLQNQLVNCPRKPNGRRYTIQQKIMALVIYKKSPACYRLLRRMFALPCQSSLNKLLNSVPLKPGINRHIFDTLKEMAQNLTDDKTICVLLFDEMHIKKNLQYNAKLDLIQGFQDHGNHGRSDEVATKALVFMLTSLRGKWKQPIAYYFSHTLSADRMTVILKEILEECFKANLNVMATVCDLSTTNLKVLKTLGTTTADPYFTVQGHEIVAVLDPPHLLKCTRNLFLKHDIECKTDLKHNESFIKGVAKWSHIELFYELDKNNPVHVYATKLSDKHVKPNLKQQMKVSYAAQIFSNTVSGGILAKITSGELPAEAHATASLLRKFDRLFDSLNADTPDLRGGKKYCTNMSPTSPHHDFYKEMKVFIRDLKYLGTRSNPPSQEGWIQTMNAVERVFKNLKKLNIVTLSTRRLNQDPLENFFGCVRYSSGSNDNPNVAQFVAGVKTAVINNLKHSGRNKNCEKDEFVLNNNLLSFLTADLKETEEETVNVSSSLSFKSSHDVIDIESVLADVIESVDKVTSESQACAYVCGFIFKNLRHNECLDCKKTFLSDAQEAMHVYTSFKEYDESRVSLNYVNKNMVICIDIMANIVNNYLKTSCFLENCRSNIMLLLEQVDFSFLSNCSIHIQENKEHLKKSVFCIYLRRFLTIKNRTMDNEDKQRALEKKLRILRNK